MRRFVSAALAVCVLLAIWAGGCSFRPAAAPAPATEATPEPTAAATSAPTASPTPAPTPAPTPCPHLRWENGVCADCGAECPHESWAGGRCAVCAMPCDHPGHDAETLVCSRCGAIVPHAYVKGVCVLCGGKPEFYDERLPRELFKPMENKGEVQILSYETDAYTPTTAKEPVVLKKEMCVYVPYGYDPAEKYDVLILLHGSGCDERYWLELDQDYTKEYLDPVYTRDLLDNLIASGHSRKVIVAAPTFYKDKLGIDNYNRKLDEPRFLNELRKDILPLLVEKYSTWAESGSPEDIAAARRHFGFAGLSMGSIYAYTGTLPECLDLFGWFGCFSGSDGYMDQLARTLNASSNAERPIYYFYNSIGTKDPYYYLHKGQYGELVGMAKGLTEGENAAFTEIRDTGHEYVSWSAGLANFLSVAFSLPPDAE